MSDLDGFSDDDWFENATLLALDEEVDPPWPDWVHDWFEGWEAYEQGGPRIFRLLDLSEAQWAELALARGERVKRLIELQAPLLIVRHAQRLAAIAMAGMMWQAAERLGRETDER